MLLVDKPAGMTSHDVVSAARRALATRRIGHTGTLDPFATGLLVLLIGHATRLLPYIDGEPKVYDATIEFGAETDTDDATGRVVREAPLPDEWRVRDAVASLTGEIEQVPPAFSAKHVGGRRAYHAARQGERIALAPARVVVHAWHIRSFAASRLEATITCGSGTYIRALARDIGRASGSAAHLVALRRTRSGPFDVTNAATLEALRAGAVTVDPPLAAIPHLAQRTLSDADLANVRQGRTVAADGEHAMSALVNRDGRLVAVAVRAGDAWQPRVVLPDA